MAPPPHSRSASASSSRSHAQVQAYTPDGTYRPPASNPAGEFDFCNAFWVFPGVKPLHHEGQDKADWGREGVEALLGRMRMGTRTLDELRGLFKDR